MCAAYGQSATTTEFCAFQQSAFLNGNMNNTAIFSLKMLAVAYCTYLQNADVLASTVGQVATLVQEVATLQQQVATSQTVLPQPINLPAPVVYSSAIGSVMSTANFTFFTTGSNPTYNLDSFSAYYTTLGAATGNLQTWAIYTTDTGGPGGTLEPVSLITSGSGPVTSANAWATSTISSGVVLKPNTTYAVANGRYPYGLAQAMNPNGPNAGCAYQMPPAQGEYPTFPQYGGGAWPNSIPTGSCVPQAAWSQYVTVH
jgi:hypothetical protein